MADKVEQILQDMVPELDDLRRKRIFDDTEVRQIVRRRRDFEYVLQGPCSVQDFLSCIRYEVALECLRRRKSKTLHWRKKSLSDFAGVRRIHFVFHRGIQRFKGDLKFWYQYIDFCLKSGSTRILSGVLLKAVKYHPREVQLWLLAADRELKHGHIKAARALLLRGLRLSPHSPKLWGEFLRLEVQVAQRLKVSRDVAEIDTSTELAGVAGDSALPEAGTRSLGVAKQGNERPPRSEAVTPTAGPWAPACLLFRRAVKRLDACPLSCADFLSTAVGCVDLDPSNGTCELSNDVHAAVGDRRPGIATDPVWTNAPGDVACALWKLWWMHERSIGRDWCGIVKVVSSQAPSVVVRHCAAALNEAEAYESPFRPAGLGAPGRALLALTKASAAAADGDTALALLEAVDRCTGVSRDIASGSETKRSGDAAADSYRALLHRAVEKHPSCIRLQILALRQLPASKSTASSMDMAALLRSMQDVESDDAVQLFLLVVASTDGTLGGAPSVTAESAFEALLRALAPGAQARPLVDMFLAEALSRGSPSDFVAACDRLVAIAARIWEVPQVRTEVLVAVLDAELRVCGDLSATAAAVGPLSQEKGRQHAARRLCTRFEELLVALDDNDVRKVDWWVRYVAFVQRAAEWGCSSCTPSSSDLHWRAMRSVADQAVYSEKVSVVLQSGSR